MFAFWQNGYIFTSLFIQKTTTMTQTRFESTKDFMLAWSRVPSGTIAYKVKCYDGDGNFCGVEYSFDAEDIEDMQAVSDGYFTETYKLTKKENAVS